MSPEYDFRVKANSKNDQEAANFKNLLNNLKGVKNVSTYEEPTPTPVSAEDMELSKAAAVLARSGAGKGGLARAAKLTPERRSSIAKDAADARWHPQPPKA